MLPSTAGGRPLDDPIFEPMWSLIEELGLLIFLHPTSAVGSERFGLHGVHVLVGWPFETTLAVTRLIFEGVLERHPGLKIILSHGGGNLVFLRGRLDSAYNAEGWEANPYYRKNISRPPSAYLDRLYYDTCALSAESNRFVIETMGEDRVMFGTDQLVWPKLMAYSISIIQNADYLTSEQKRDILYNNAVRFLRLDMKAAK